MTSIYQLFYQSYKLHPEQVAAKDANIQVTYAELYQKVVHLGSRLINDGIGLDDIVIVFLDKSIDTLIGLLSVSYSGAAFLPLDDDIPKNRLSYIVENSKAKAIISKNKVITKYGHSKIACFERNNVELNVTKLRAPVKKLDQLPFIDRTLIDYQKYSKYTHMSMFKDSIAIQATRGCPYHCAYCHKILSKKHIVRSAENIFAEIKLYYDAGVTDFYFIDDVFNLNVKNSSNLFKLLIDNGLKVQLGFPNGIRGDILTKDYIDLMVEAGLVNVAFPLETASPRLQKLISKNLNIKKFRENLEYIVSKYPHVIVDLFAMLGFPTETEQEAILTQEFIKSIKWLHFPYLHVLKIFPNTEMYDLALKNGVSKDDIHSSLDRAYHELPDTLNFSKSFARQIQTDFLNEYFLNKDRLKKVLPVQATLLCEKEMIKLYRGYLLSDIRSFPDLLNHLELSEVPKVKFALEKKQLMSNMLHKVANKFPKYTPKKEALKILMIEASLLFTSDASWPETVVDAPYGLMTLLTFLNNKYRENVFGKIIHSMMDFNNYEELGHLVQNFKPDVIGIRSLSYYKDFFHQIVAYLRSIGLSVPIVAGGPYASSSYKYILQDYNVDLVVIGEGEITFSELIGAMLDAGKKLPDINVLSNINGLAFRKNNSLNLSNKIYLISSNHHSEFPILDSRLSNPQDLSYVVYTSGSTGQPKGVMVEEKGIKPLVKSWKNLYGKKLRDFRVLQIAPFSTDVFIGDLLKSVSTAGMLYIASKQEVLDLSELLKIIAENNLNLLESVPSFLLLFFQFAKANKANLTSMKICIIGGETCSPIDVAQLVADYRGQIEFYNGYGLTELTIESVVANLSKIKNLANYKYMPIGSALSGVKFFIVDDQGKFLKKGNGELVVSGSGVARGYLESGKFDGERYHTGDLVEYDGKTLYYIGRKDKQIQIRGFRVEPAEIEQQLKTTFAMDTIVITAKIVNQDSKLFLYYTSKENIKEHDIYVFLKTNLPLYMIPGQIIKVSNIPRLPNGKIDYKLLEQSSNDFDEANPCLKEVKDIWQNILGKKNIKSEDDFFDLGGSSLDAVRLVIQLEDKGYKLNVNDIYNFSVCYQFSKLLASKIVKDNSLNDDLPVAPGQVINFKDDLIRLRAMEQKWHQLLFYKNRILRKYSATSYQWISEKLSQKEIFCNSITIQNLSKEQVVDRLGKLYVNQPILRSKLSNDCRQWLQYDLPDSFECPYLDFVNRSDEELEYFKKKVLPLYFFKDNKALFQFVLIKQNVNDHVLVYAFGESIYDYFCDSIIEDAIFSQSIQKKSSYYEYILELKKPISIGEQEIIDSFDLHKFFTYSKDLKQYMQFQNEQKQKKFKEHTLFIPVSENVYKNKSWEFALDLISKLLAKYIPIQGVPLWLEYHGRVFRGKHYFDCIGDFTQFIPVSLPLGGIQGIQKIKNHVSSLAEQGINFLEIMSDPKLVRNYPEIQTLLPISSLPKLLQQDKGEDLFPAVIYHNQLHSDTGNMVAETKLSDAHNLFSEFIHIYSVYKDNKLQIYIR